MTDREKDVLIAKAMGYEVIDWYYNKDPECGGLEPVIEDKEGKPDLSLMDGCGVDGRIGKMYRESVILEPTLKTLYAIREDGSPCYDYKPIPDYSSPEDSWLILDYLRESDDEDFVDFFQGCFESLLPSDGEFRYSFWEILPYLTPERIRDAAYEAAKHLVKE